MRPRASTDSPGVGATDRRVDPRAVAGLTALVTLPLAVALVALRHPTWVPLFDLTMTELKVRDVGSPDPPLVGLAGRIGPVDQPGSHPGPLAYWLLWPVYRLLGQTSWALQVSAVVFHSVAIAISVWIAGRRGGLRLAVGVTGAFALVVGAFGAVLFTVPWNPHLPVLWWLVFLLALWSVLVGDLPLLPVAVLAGSIIAQTHVPYLALTISVVAVVVLAGLGVAIAARSRDDAPTVDRRSAVRWLVASMVLGTVLWLPPLIDQLTQDPGNARILVDHFRSPTSDPIGLTEGARVVVERLNPVALLTHDVAVEGFTPSSTLVPGAVLLVLWVVSVSVAWRHRRSALLALDVVAGSAVLLGVVAASRIFGGVWNYLLLWAWVTGALLVVATAWGLSLAAPRSPDTGLGRFATPALLALVVVSTAFAAADATDAEVSGQMRSTQTGEVATQSAEALADRRDDRFLITWNDPTHLGTQGWGLILELERRGFEVFGSSGLAEMLGDHRVADAGEVDAILTLAVGPAIDELRTDPSAVEIAYTDHERARRDARRRLIDDVTTTLREQGDDDLAVAAEQQPASARSDPSMPRPLARLLADAAELGYPVAVFLIEPTAGD